jgi:hypothetical protein
MALRTRLTDRLGIRHLVLPAPMGGNGAGPPHRLTLRRAYPT